MDLDRPIAPDPYTKLPPVPSFDLVSDDIVDGETMREPFTAAEDVSPHLAWSEFPDETQSFLVTCFDPDAPRPQGYWHWTVVDLPRTTTELPQGAGSPRGTLLPPGAYQLTNDDGATGYVGAWPPPGDRVHRYFFAVHALDVPHLEVDVASEPRDVAIEAAKHTVARAVIVPVFRR